MTKTISKNSALTAYKAFNSKLQCKSYQFEVGKEYEHVGKVDICNSGFHSCLNPFDCLSYYDLIDVRFCEVEIWGEASTEDESKDSKHCTSHILIRRELTVKEFHKICVDFTIKDSTRDSAQNASSGDYAQNASSGDSAKNASSGYSAKNASSGDYATSVVTGKNSVDASIGKNSKTKGIIDTWITLAEYDDKNICIMVKSAKIDGKKLKADTFYTLKNKKFTEVK